MRKYLAKYLGFLLQDIIKKTNILQTKDFLLGSQYWDLFEIESYQFKKFKALIEHAYKNVPYYQDLFKKINLSTSDINSFKDIDKIPILTKDIARKENKNLVAKNISKKNIRIGKTGGTTGIPLIIRNDIQTRSFVWGAFYRWYYWMEIELGDPVLVLWGAPQVLSESFTSKLKSEFIYYFQNIYKINSFDLNSKNFPHYIKKIKKFKPKLIRGYLSTILQLAKYIEQNRITGIGPVAISTTSETILPPHRQYIERIFNAPLYDQYGCGECESIAFECSHHNGLHINNEHVYLEILNTTGQPIKDKSGKIIITDLDNYIMPFIRYENGDLTSLGNEKCSCGINQPLLKNICGRIKDTIILKNGSRVHGVFFTNIFYEMDLPDTILINRFQVYQATPGEIELRLESDRRLNNKYISDLVNALYHFFSKVEIKVMDKLQNDKSGKFRYILSDNEFI